MVDRWFPGYRRCQALRAGIRPAPTKKTFWVDYLYYTILELQSQRPTDSLVLLKTPLHAWDDIGIRPYGLAMSTVI